MEAAATTHIPDPEGVELYCEFSTPSGNEPREGNSFVIFEKSHRFVPRT